MEESRVARIKGRHLAMFQRLSILTFSSIILFSSYSVASSSENPKYSQNTHSPIYLAGVGDFFNNFKKDLGKAVDDVSNAVTGNAEKKDNDINADEDTSQAQSRTVTASPSSLTREENRQIQQYLIDAGYNPGPADGYPGEKTKAAIKQYQLDNGLPTDGKPSKDLLAVLQKVDSKKQKSVSLESKTTQRKTTNYCPNVRYSKSNPGLEFQRGVEIIGIKPMPYDEYRKYFKAKRLNKSSQYIAAYQKAKGINITGEVSTGLFSMLSSDIENKHKSRCDLVNKDSSIGLKSLGRTPIECCVKEYNFTFAGKDLNGLSLRTGNYDGVDFSNSDLTEAVFIRVSLNGANFSGADLRKAQFHKTKLDKASFTKSKLDGTAFIEASMNQVNFDNSKISNSHFASLELNNSSFRNIDGNQINFTSASLKKSDFSNSSLIWLQLQKSDLTGSDLSNTDLNKTLFDLANLKNVNFTGAKNITKLQLDQARNGDKTIGFVESVEPKAKKPVRSYYSDTPSVLPIKKSIKKSDGSQVAEKLITYLSGKSVSYKTPAMHGNPAMDISVFVCSNGEFLFKDNLTGGQGNIGGGSALRTGKWSVYSQAGKGFIQLAFNDGDSANYEAMVQGGKTYIDGDVVSVSDMNPLCK